MDAVFPPMEEIYYCIRKNLVSKKELVVYKMLIDTYESIFYQKYSMNGNSKTKINMRSMVDSLIPCSKRFYEMLDQ
jgi:hypothetical protein